MADLTHPLPLWWKEMINHFCACNFHQFLFDGNIYDKFFWCFDDENKGKLYSFREFLIRALLRSFEVVFYYSTTNGMVVYKRDSNLNFTEASEKELSSGIMNILETAVKDSEKKGIPTCSSVIQDEIIKNLLKLEKALTIEWKVKVKVKVKTKEEEKKVRIATVIDYLDKIISDMRKNTENHICERVQQWGLNMKIKDTGNISILIAENRELLPQIFHTDSAGTMPIGVFFPDANYRKLYFDKQKGETAEKSLLIKYLKGDENKVATIVQLTKGFRISDCELVKNIADRYDLYPNMAEQFLGSKNPSPEGIEDFIKEEKKDVIYSSSKGMLEPVESNIEFGDIGGLEKVKDYFKKASNAIIKRDENSSLIEIIPKGVLLAGPPGTGKTLIAKALTKEAGVSLVKMGDIRSKWVGESEKNMTLTLNLLKAMAPIIVFIDEIDQAIGRRATGAGDSGVSGRIFGKILEFMGDNENRGDVIWIAATNRADLLDDAMIRRFDRVIPVLLPGSEEEWISVIKGIVNQMESKIEEEDIERFVIENINLLRKNHSGSSIEMVLRAAYQRAIERSGTNISLEDLKEVFSNFKTNFNEKVYELQTLLAISACNEIGFIPRPSDEYSYGDDALNDMVEKAIDSKSNEPLEEEIKKLKQELGLLH